MRRSLYGSLDHLGPSALLRLLEVTKATGVLELVTGSGALRLEVVSGRVAHPTEPCLHHAARVLASASGSFRFDPCELREPDGETIALTGLVEDTRSGEVSRAEIWHLAEGESDNPLEDLVGELESNAPDELLIARVGVVTLDPRIWRGSLAAGWRRRGWAAVTSGDPDTVDVGDLDVVVVHHQLSITRVGREDAWTDLVNRAVAEDVPVVWIGPLGDPAWVHRLVIAGVSFLLPAISGEASGASLARLAEDVAVVVDRLLSRHPVAEAGSAAASELVEALLHGIDGEQAVGSLLQLASASIHRGAVLAVDDTTIRCRAGFGYLFGRGRRSLPRGLSILERVIRSGEPVRCIDPTSTSAGEIARMLGLDRLEKQTAILPLGSSGRVVGLLVGDRNGEEVGDLDDLVRLGRRLGAAIIHR